MLGCLIGWYSILNHLYDPLHPDAEHVYLPAARALLEQGWAFLLSAGSYRVVPLGYMWPALWGADPVVIRLANGALWAGCVFAAWRCACLLGGMRAGAITVALLALHPELRKYFSTELTEPIFLFGLFGWLWTLAEWLIARNASRALRACSAALLTLTLLSRPVLQLLVPLGLLVLMVLAWHWRSSARAPRQAAARLCRQMVPVLAASLALPVLLVLKNGLLFGLWGLGTGSGAGLYLGTHLLFQGAEPPFLGFHYDVTDFVFRMTGNADHLEIAGDRAASAAALAQLGSLSFGEGVAFFARKLWWWVAHHPVYLETHGSALRKIRLFEWLVLAAAATHIATLWRQHGAAAVQQRFPVPCLGLQGAQQRQDSALRQAMMCLLLCALGGALLVQLLPILYNSRYSSALLDPFIMLLTGFGVAYLTHPYTLRVRWQRSRWQMALTVQRGHAPTRARLWPGVFTVPALLLLSILIFNTVRRYEMVAIDPQHLGTHRTHLALLENAALSANGMKKHADGLWRMTESPEALVYSVSAAQVMAIQQQPLLNALWEFNLAVTPPPKGRCRRAEIAYTSPSNVTMARRSWLEINADGRSHLYAVHANAHLRPGAAGDLRIALHCPTGTAVQWNGARFLESTYTENAQQQLIHAPK